ncbi:hypothetical protein EVAR_91871_1 [Eumeta japonica]|uniref:Uncharacterized protein n=1 Tax=Eumeta variegata TaxID=151549 RepID=A0A4C1TIV1_EUMVA|nr:hypothetical protein EVAR_91871_1 [Eumeta japonica]
MLERSESMVQCYTYTFREGETAEQLRRCDDSDVHRRSNPFSGHSGTTVSLASMPGGRCSTQPAGGALASPPQSRRGAPPRARSGQRPSPAGRGRRAAELSRSFPLVLSYLTFHRPPELFPPCRLTCNSKINKID